MGVEVKKAFPFRPVDFYAAPKAAMDLLDWTPTEDLEKVLTERYVYPKPHIYIYIYIYDYEEYQPGMLLI